jgi:regulator of replication initiation timing
MQNTPNQEKQVTLKELVVDDFRFLERSVFQGLKNPIESLGKSVGQLIQRNEYLTQENERLKARVKELENEKTNSLKKEAKE